MLPQKIARFLRAHSKNSCKLKTFTNEAIQIFNQLAVLKHKTNLDSCRLNELAHYFAIRKQAYSVKDSENLMDWRWYTAIAFFVADNFPSAVLYLKEFIVSGRKIMKKLSQNQVLSELQQKIAEAEVKLHECLIFNNHQLIGNLIDAEDNKEKIFSRVCAEILSSI